MSKPRVLVTGGSGFIGAFIVKRLLESGYGVRILDLAPDQTLAHRIAGRQAAETVEWVQGDVADTAAVMQAAGGCRHVIHLAALLTPGCQADPIKGAAVNVTGTLNVFLAALEHGMAPPLYMSTAAVYGPDHANYPEPNTLYGAYKLAGERAAVALWQDRGLSSVGFRPFVVYGPGRERGMSAAPTLACRAIARGEPYIMPFAGSFDLIHADDVALALLQLLDAPPEGAHVFNLLGHATDSQSVIDILRGLEPEAQLGIDGPDMPFAMPAPDETLARLLPGWRPRPLEEGLAETIAFYREETD